MVFEDPYLVVIDKKAGYLTVPNMSDHNAGNTVIGALEKYLGRGQRGRRIFVVHRLDRDTSGLLVFAKTKDIALALEAQFTAHKPEREYVAIVHGRMKSKQGTFKSILRTDKNLNQRSTRRSEDGELAITHYKIIKVLERTTVVSVSLETGKRNQIRVHFAEAGHPIVGDRRYGDPSKEGRSRSAMRLALHAKVLGFEHPVKQEPMRFESAPHF